MSAMLQFNVEVPGEMSKELVDKLAQCINEGIHKSQQYFVKKYRKEIIKDVNSNLPKELQELVDGLDEFLKSLKKQKEGK